MASSLRLFPRTALHSPLRHQARRPLPVRYASTSSSAPRRFISTTLLLASGAVLVAYYYDSRSILHEHVLMPVIRRIADPEQGHKLAIRLLSSSEWLRPRDRGIDGDELQAEIFGMKVSNPIGMAAGFDKDGEAIDGLFDLGFGYVEIGSVTPEPQPGNPKPRFFRLNEDSAAINRYGFNSYGHYHALSQLRARVLLFSRDNPSLFPSPCPANPLPPSSLPRSLRPGRILAVNLGKNKTSPADSNEDYIKGVRVLGPYADVLVVNVSSPNTPGLRALQGREILERLLKDVVGERDRIAGKSGLPKIAVKVASDLTEEELGDVAMAVRSSGVEGVIISNTTIRREGLGLKSANQKEIGGLSGKPLFPLALQALKTLRPLLPPSIPIIGAGGISSGSDALLMANAGASLVQVYTSFGYRGVGTARLLKDEVSSAIALGSGGGWKSQIGTDYPGGKMGWVEDEHRLKRSKEEVKAEAKGLGELLRGLKEKEDVQSLMKEAEAALSKFASGSGSQAKKKGTGTGTASGEPGSQPRDNLLGAAPARGPEHEHRRREREASRGLVEDTLSPHVAEAASTPAHTATVTEGMVGSVPELLRAILPDPAVDLAPIVVVQEETKPEAEVSDPWADSVRTGGRRLV